MGRGFSAVRRTLTVSRVFATFSIIAFLRSLRGLPRSVRGLWRSLILAAFVTSSVIVTAETHVQ